MINNWFELNIIYFNKIKFTFSSYSNRLYIICFLHIPYYVIYLTDIEVCKDLKTNNILDMIYVHIWTYINILIDLYKYRVVIN